MPSGNQMSAQSQANVSTKTNSEITMTNFEGPHCKLTIYLMMLCMLLFGNNSPDIVLKQSKKLHVIIQFEMISF